MQKLVINFFKNSMIYFDGNVISLPIIKAEGILYYLVIENIVYKDELCNLLWPDFPEQMAQKNFRNAIYILRKSLAKDLIIIPKKNMIQLNPDIIVETDIKYLLDNSFDTKEKIEGFLEFYNQNFLEHFNIKACNNFYEWILVNQERYKMIYLERLLLAKNGAKFLGLMHLYEKCLLILIELEPYEENYYLQLMTYWQVNNRKKECLDLYGKLKKILKDDLCIEPHDNINLFMENLLPQKLNKHKSFYGRLKERQCLSDNYRSFIQNQEFTSYLVLGEAGIGKSKLIDDFLYNINDEDCIKIDVTCYRVDKEISYKLWDSILEVLSTIIINKNIILPLSLVKNINGIFPSFDIDEKYTNKANNPYLFHQAETMIIQLLEIISKKNKVVLVVDNMQWVDENSINLLEATLIKCRKNLLLIATSRETEDEIVNKIYYDLYRSGAIKKLELSRFSKEETKEMVKFLDQNAVSKYRLIYKESEGNPFFITEILNNFQAGMDIKFVNQNMSDLIGSRMIVLSDNAKGILNICSVFQSDFSFNMIASISGLSNFVLIDVLDELRAKKFILEYKNARKEELFYFSHQKIKEYIYYNLLHSKRKVLHKRVAQYYESNLLEYQNDRFYYYKMIYHFKKARNGFKTLKYHIKYLEIVLRFQHELFPTFEKVNIMYNAKFYDTENIEKEFNEIETALKNLNIDNEEFVELEIIYLHLRGRYYESIGESGRSISLLEKMVELATKWQKGRYIYEGYLQLILHGINIYDLKYVDKIIAKAKELEYIKNNPLCLANIMRHEGYNYVHNGDFVKGEKMILDAINSLLGLNNDEGSLIISASYYCLGESQYMKGDYISSLKYYKKSLEYNTPNDSAFNLSVICLGIGISYFHHHDMDKADKFLNQALKHYEQSIFLWRKSMLYCYLARVALIKGKESLAKEYYKKAWSIYPKYSSKLEKNELMLLKSEFENKNIDIDIL